MIKKTVFIILITAAATAVCAAGGKKDAPAGESPPATPAQLDLSYAVGMMLGKTLQDSGITYDFNYTELFKGLRDMAGGAETRLSEEQAIALVQGIYREMYEREAEQNRLGGEAFLTENLRRESVNITASGLQYEVIAPGTGPRPGPNDTVLVNYEVSLPDGTMLGSSLEEGEPMTVPLNEVIPGWSEGIQLMPVGSTFKLYLPPALAYGEGGGLGIPPNATLVFRIELLSILDGGAR